MKLRFCAVALLPLALVSCGRLRKKPPPPVVDAAAPVVAADPVPTATMLEAKDLPLGHWETTEGEKFCLSILPDGLVRFATPVPHYRNAARVFGQLTHIEGDDADTFRIWVEVSKILAKEIGPCHRHWEDYELFEAEILGSRVTSPNVNGHHIPELGGQGPAPPPSYKLKFDKPREHLEVCTLSRTPVCRSLTKKKSPSDLSRVRPNPPPCKGDEDCVVVTEGEQCDACLCPSKPSARSWPRKSTDPTQEDLSWETKPEHMCGKALPRRDNCPPCPELHAVCKQKQCVLKP